MGGNGTPGIDENVVDVAVDVNILRSERFVNVEGHRIRARKLEHLVVEEVVAVVEGVRARHVVDVPLELLVEIMDLKDH